MGAELFRADRQAGRQTDVTDLIVAFRNFANAPKIVLFFSARVCIPQFVIAQLDDCFILADDIVQSTRIVEELVLPNLHDRTVRRVCSYVVHK